jgi:cytoskeletal protein CcmA (bactofilin family)
MVAYLTVPINGQEEQMVFKNSVAAPHTVSSTYLAAGSNLQGQIVSEGDVDVLGHFEGTIIARRLTIFEGASVKGKVSVQSFIVDGEFSGRADAGRIRVGAQSIVQGELNYRELAVILGANLDARCQRQHRSLESDALADNINAVVS